MGAQERTEVMRVRLWLAGLAVGLVVLGSAIAGFPFAGLAQTDDDNGNGAPVVGTPLLTPAIDLVRAQEIALEGQTGAVVTALELEGEEGRLLYEIELDNGVEVEIDATTGEVVETEQDDDGDDEGDD